MKAEIFNLVIRIPAITPKSAPMPTVMSMEPNTPRPFKIREVTITPERLATEAIDMSKSPGIMQTVIPVAIIVSMEIWERMFMRFLEVRNVSVIIEKKTTIPIKARIVPYF